MKDDLVLIHFNPYHDPRNGQFSSSGGINVNYSSQQQIRDKKLYGKGAVKRINKRMNKGESIQSARHDEVVRTARKPYVKQVVTGGLEIAGAVPIGNTAAVAAYALTGKEEVAKVIGNSVTLGLGVSGVYNTVKGVKGISRVNRKYS